MRRPCECCNEMFYANQRGGTPPRYCSARCRGLARRGGAYQKATEDTSPGAWDGQTQYSTSELIETYSVSCISCGDVEYVRMTAAEVKRHGRWSACERCGGTRWIEPDCGSRIAAVSGERSAHNAGVAVGMWG